MSSEIHSPKNGIIFGVTGDIGSAIAERLSEITENLYCVSRKKSDLINNNKETKALQLTIDFPQDRDHFINQLHNLNIKFDFVINAIGYYEVDKNYYDVSVFYRNLQSNYHILQYIAESIEPFIEDNGTFVNISSIASHSGSTHEYGYSSSKLLVDKFMHQFSLNHRNKFRTTNIRLGAVKSSMTQFRSDQHLLIKTEDISNLVFNIISLGESICIPIVDVFRAKKE